MFPFHRIEVRVYQPPLRTPRLFHQPGGLYEVGVAFALRFTCCKRPFTARKIGLSADLNHPYAERIGKSPSQYLSRMTRSLFFVLLGLGGCVQPPARSPGPTTTLARFNRFYAPRADAQRADSNVVVFPFHPDDTLAFVPRLTGPLVPAALSPAEAGATDSLVRAVEHAHPVASPPYRYRYQYLPVVDGRGAKHVWVNAFCRSPSSWATQVVAFKGGGACFYRVQLNLTTRRYASFSTNAPK